MKYCFFVKIYKCLGWNHYSFPFAYQTLWAFRPLSTGLFASQMLLSVWAGVFFCGRMDSVGVVRLRLGLPAGGRDLCCRSPDIYVHGEQRSARGHKHNRHKEYGLGFAKVLNLIFYLRQFQVSMVEWIEALASLLLLYQNLTTENQWDSKWKTVTAWLDTKSRT